MLIPKTFANFARHNLLHATFTRGGGTSDAPFHSLNVGFHVGDVDASVLENRRIIKEHLGLSRLISAKQVHGDKVLVVDQMPDEDVEYDGYDALVTNQLGVGLMIQQADCQAIMLYDPEHGAVANAHSGWRGSVQNIIAKTVAVMRMEYGSRPEALVAAISPSLGPCCGEFIHYHTELPLEFHAYQPTQNHFDFWAISRDQLTACGLRRENIEVAGVCTVCDPQYFSYRRERETGRCGSVIGILLRSRIPIDCL